MITINGKEFRNLVEQVKKNQEDIQTYHNLEQVLADWGIKVLGHMDEWEEPTGSFNYGDSYAVGLEPPYDYYIYTRGAAQGTGFWFNNGPISIVGPKGEPGEMGPPGAPGVGSKWYVGPNVPTGDVHENDMWLKTNSDGTTNGFVYQYRANGWALFTSILGPQGIQGPEGKEGKQGPIGPTGPQGPRGYTTITNIIGELPEGSVISDTFNPTQQPDNATVLMPVSGVQHAWIIINGIWTDVGPYSGGSTVYVDGQAVNSFDADTKLNARTGTTTYDMLYMKNKNGTQGIVNVQEPGAAWVASGIPRFSAGGVFATGTPTWGSAVANKTYVDTKIAEEIAKVHNGGSMKSYLWFGQGGIIAGGHIQLGIFEYAFNHLEVNSAVEIPTAVLYYQMSAGTPIYYSVPYGALSFKLISGTAANGTYQIGFIDGGAAVAQLGATCSIENGILTIDAGHGATGCMYGYAVLIVPPSWSAEW